jgi:hypothetical protein
MRAFFVLLLLLPALASAQVYMCVNPVTGKTSFTDRACNVDGSGIGEEVKVGAPNLDSGQRDRKPAAQEKLWNSERDLRKTGRDYNAERRVQHGEAAAFANR